MNHKLKEAAVPAIVAILLAVGGMALLFGWMGCEGGSPPGPNDEPVTRAEALTTFVEADPAEVPDLISDATGGAVTTPEVDAGLKKTQQENPGLPWPAIITLYVLSLGSKKILPHILGPALPFIAGLNPLIGLVASLVASTSETTRVKEGNGMLWRKPTTLTTKTGTNK